MNQLMFSLFRKYRPQEVYLVGEKIVNSLSDWYKDVLVQMNQCYESEPIAELGDQGVAEFGAFFFSMIFAILEFGEPRERCGLICNDFVTLFRENDDKIYEEIEKRVGSYRHAFSQVMHLQSNGKFNTSVIRAAFDCPIMNPLEVLTVKFLEAHNAPKRHNIHSVLAVITITTLVFLFSTQVMVDLKKCGFKNSSLFYSPQN
jgi:hypothetical protein